MQLALEDRFDSVKIVLVEDNAGDEYLITRMFRGRKTPQFMVTPAHSLADGERAIERVHPDAVLLDLSLPDCRGLETVRRIRRVNNHVPIVVLTGHSDSQTALAAMSEGAQDYLTKGNITAEVLVRTVQYAIVRGRLSERHRHTLERLAQAEKLEAVGRLAAGIAHDFNNLLTVLKVHADLLKDRPQTEEVYQSHVEAIHAAVDHATVLTDQLLAFCRGRPYKPSVIELNQVLDAMLPILRRLAGDACTIRPELSDGSLLIRADRGQIEQIVMNLVVNARDASPFGGEIALRSSALSQDAARNEPGAALPAGPMAVIDVIDHGVGMDQATQARIFEPFFTTKERGVGLGLATVFGIVQQCAGVIAVHSAPNAGADFRVYLPIAGSDENRPDSAGTSNGPLHASDERTTVLLIEDEAMVRRALSKTLEQHGYSVWTAKNGDEALQLVADSGGEIDCIVSDIILPGQTGPELARELTRRCAHCVVLFVSGWAGAPELPELGVPTAFLAKPFTQEALVCAVERLCNASRN